MTYDIDLVFRDGEEKSGEVRINNSLDADSAAELLQLLEEPLDRSIRNWRIHLEEMEFCDSFTLGILLKIHLAIKKNSGHARFMVRKGSSLSRTLDLTNLSKVLSVDEI